MRALIGIGRLLTKTHSKGGAYSGGGAYWKEGAKSNHYGRPVLIVPGNFPTFYEHIRRSLIEKCIEGKAEKDRLYLV